MSSVRTRRSARAAANARAARLALRGLIGGRGASNDGHINVRSAVADVVVIDADAAVDAAVDADVVADVDEDEQQPNDQMETTDLTTTTTATATTSTASASANASRAVGAPQLLMYFVGAHERMGSPPGAWDFLTIQDMLRLTLVSKSLREKLATIEYSRCRDGKNYVVPYPGFPGLLSTEEDMRFQAGLFPHQLADLQAMRKVECATQEFGALRGGILGDAPGLGKTISMLALIVSTSGQRPSDPPEFWDGSSLQQDWELVRQNPAKQEDILRMMRSIRLWIRDIAPLYMDLYSEVAQFVSPPYPDDRLPTVQAFQRHVFQQFGKVVPSGVLEDFRAGVVEMKSLMDKRSRKVFASTSSSSRRLVWERQLLPTSATLIIVPDALLEHWHQQICRHINFDAFTSHDRSRNGGGRGANSAMGASTSYPRGLVYLDGIGDMADIPGKSLLGSHIHSSPSPPKRMELSQCIIVVTTFSRCSRYYGEELKLGHFGSTEASSASSSRSSSRRSSSRKRSHQESSKKYGMNPFLSIRWLRLVVDEGHELGSHETTSDATHFINQIAAERRWVMSGTPTTGDEDNNGFNESALDQIQRLLLFLRHPVYGSFNQQQQQPNVATPTAGARAQSRSRAAASTTLTTDNANVDTNDHGDEDGDDYDDGDDDDDEDDDANGHDHSDDDDPGATDGAREEEARSKWDVEVKRPFLERTEEGREALVSIVKSLFVMHRKEDIHLPKPIFEQAEVDIMIPDMIQDMILAGSKLRPKQTLDNFQAFLTSDEFHSTIDKAQADHIAKILKDARQTLRSNGGANRIAEGRVDMSTEPTAAGGIDRRPVKAVVYSKTTTMLLSVTEQLYRQLSPENIAEVYASASSDIGGELYRFRHDVKECRRCSVCERLTHLNSKEGRRSVCQQILIEVVVREGSDDEARILIEPERIVRALNVPLDRLRGEPLSNYYKSRAFWRPGDKVLIDIRDDHPLHPKRKSEEYWDGLGAETCRILANSDQFAGRDWYFGPLPAVAAAAADADAGADGADPANGGNAGAETRVEGRIMKWQACGSFHSRSRWFTGNAFHDAPIERIHEDVFLLSLDAELSHGLDLSFVTHMFLLEPIDDAALLEQVTSRANRLGATGPVRIETVNTFFQLSGAAQAALDSATTATQAAAQTKARGRDDALSQSSTADQPSPARNGESSTPPSRMDKAKRLNKVVCQHCFRQFDSYTEAEGHEANCPRNPNSHTVVDRFHLSSIYHEIKPPPALST